MTDTLWTLGPYTVDADLAGNDRVISGAGGEVVALVVGTNPDEDPDNAGPLNAERDANARLLGAAWEMRSHLIDALNVLLADMDRGRATIAVAGRIRALLARIDTGDEVNPNDKSSNDDWLASGRKA